MNKFVILKSSIISILKTLTDIIEPLILTNLPIPLYHAYIYAHHYLYNYHDCEYDLTLI